MNNQKHDAKKYAQDLGRLITNLQTLEFTLRGCLFEDELAKGISDQSPDYQLVEGNVIPESAYTNWDTLDVLIRKYNNLPTSKGFKIEKNIVKLRDAMAHGRILAFSPTGINQLVKFEKPENNEVKIEFSVSMTDEWFGKEIRKLFDVIQKANTVFQKLNTTRLKS